MLFKVVAVCSLAAVAFAYPSGAPEGTCATLTPKHQVTAQNSKSSHVIYVSPNAIRGGTPTSGEFASSRGEESDTVFHESSKFFISSESFYMS